MYRIDEDKPATLVIPAEDNRATKVSESIKMLSEVCGTHGDVVHRIPFEFYVRALAKGKRKVVLQPEQCEDGSLVVFDEKSTEFLAADAMSQSLPELGIRPFDMGVDGELFQNLLKKHQRKQGKPTL